MPEESDNSALCTRVCGGTTELGYTAQCGRTASATHERVRDGATVATRVWAGRKAVSSSRARLTCGEWGLNTPPSVRARAAVGCLKGHGRRGERLRISLRSPRMEGGRGVRRDDAKLGLELRGGRAACATAWSPTCQEYEIRGEIRGDIREGVRTISLRVYMPGRLARGWERARVSHRPHAG